MERWIPFHVENNKSMSCPALISHRHRLKHLPTRSWISTETRNSVHFNWDPPGTKVIETWILHREREIRAVQIQLNGQLTDEQLGHSETISRLKLSLTLVRGIWSCLSTALILEQLGSTFGSKKWTFVSWLPTWPTTPRHCVFVVWMWKQWSALICIDLHWLLLLLPISLCAI